MPKSACKCETHSCEPCVDPFKRFQYDKKMIDGDMCIVNGYHVDEDINDCERKIKRDKLQALVGAKAVKNSNCHEYV